MDADLDHYATLGVEPSADAPSIRAAYRALAQRYHPDKAGESDAEAVLRMVEINAAYRVLGDPARRAEYDRHREPPPRGPDPAGRPPETTGIVRESRSDRGPRLRGISARRYARRHRLSVEEVIDMIRCGDLPGFKRRGNYYVLPAWRREAVTSPSGDPAGCLLAVIIVLILVLAVVILFVEEWPTPGSTGMPSEQTPSPAPSNADHPGTPQDAHGTATTTIQN